ncbi:YggS family pyridoxal phosphate-dependent enzyme [Planctomicrobium sp. SH664]|uniref:YggS family pyridoxal phosphate-dependent enzyme n=1 Tax=Planctomicrobium sp. SH664 TaxID=3448125 RepID=UPI003F5B4877
MLPLVRDRIALNLAGIRERIAAACARVGRAPDEVRLVAVTKYSPLAAIQALTSLGHVDLGENRPQQLMERAQALAAGETSDLSSAAAAPIRWHLIGQLQRNKVRAVLPYVALIHSVDSLKLLERISQIAGELQLQPRVLLQLSLAGEETKSGFTAAELRAEWSQLSALPHVQLSGLMTMAPLTEDHDLIDRTFRSLRELRDELQAGSPQLKLTELSMGMSGDFEQAIEAGATLIRIGSTLFAGTDELLSRSPVE